MLNLDGLESSRSTKSPGRSSKPKGGLGRMKHNAQLSERGKQRCELISKLEAAQEAAEAHKKKQQQIADASLAFANRERAVSFRAGTEVFAAAPRPEPDPVEPAGRPQPTNYATLEEEEDEDVPTAEVEVRARRTRSWPSPLVGVTTHMTCPCAALLAQPTSRQAKLLAVLRDL